MREMIQAKRYTEVSYLPSDFDDGINIAQRNLSAYMHDPKRQIGALT